ncbi:39S ribosomal protein L1, mitochondrial isoform X1 [Dromiciops gliroides]|uniref:39S ribosomal protein L1, mitochondrial isoform X1 n=2 Tax=Dromiciops gliroides TaxID=33562 RepID=UPI001CC6BB51|nr:39S ribosomal protein L1, mitochondrial isoform X1 [Dromiciops gliroides]
MAAATSCFGRVFLQCQRQCLSRITYNTSVASCVVNGQAAKRHYVAAKPAKKEKKGSKVQTKDAKTEDIEKLKTYTYMEGEPEDDVYLKRLFPRQIYEVEKAINLLKKFQILDYSNPKQGVYLDLTLDMALGKKKKKVEPFVSVLNFPYPFISKTNKILVFTEKESDIKIAEENGAAFAGGSALIQKILDDEIQADFYVSVPEMMPALQPLRRKLKKRFPRPSQNSINHDIVKMLQFFKAGYEIAVDEERENFLQTQIALLDMPTNEIAANLQAVITDVCRHKPQSSEPFVVRAFLRSSTSEGLLIKIEHLMPQEKVKAEESIKETI